MNLRKIRRRLINFSAGKICIVLLLIYTFMCSSDLNYATYMDMSIAEYVLYALTDHYYMIYAWLFFLIFFSVCQIKEKSLIERMRYGTLREFYMIERLAKIIQLTGIIVLHGFIPFIIGITRLKCNNIFAASLSTDVYDSRLEVITAYAECFKTPLTAIICVLAYWIVGSLFISQMIEYCSEIWQKKGAAASIIFLLISTMCGFMTDMDEHFFEFIFLNNYYILHHVLLNIGIIPMVVNLSIMVVGIIILEKLATLKNCNKCNRKKGIYKVLFTVRPISYLLFFSILIFLGVIGMAGGEKDAYKVVWSLVKGFSYHGFQLTEFLYYIAPMVFVLFFVNAAWEREKKCCNELAMLRVGSRKKWNKIMEKSCEKFLIKSYGTYFGVLLIVSTSFIIMFGIGGSEWLQEITEYYGVTERIIFSSILISWLLRILEWYLLYSIDRFLYVLTNNSTISYIVTFTMYILGFVFTNPYISILGRGSAYQMIELFAEGMEFVLPITITANVGIMWILNCVSGNRKLIARKEIKCQR